MDLSKRFEVIWYNKLKHYIETDHFERKAKEINLDRKKNIVLPPRGSDLLFKVFKVTPFNSVKVVILGQDPYHGDNQFDGLSFSNSTLDYPQPSLSNILKEVERDIYEGFNLNRITDLSLYKWAEQGVLLTNVAHTVIKGNPGSHIRYWREFTNTVIDALNNKDDVVWLLWGKFAQGYEPLITNSTHRIIKTSHPSPLGVTKAAPIPFRGSKCFSKCNEYLKNSNITEIIW